MADFHGEIINDICEMVGWIAIILENYLIINFLVIEYDLAVDDILELSLAFGYFHSDDVGITVGFLLLDLLLRVIMEAESVVLCLGVFLAANLNTHFLKAFSRAETGIGIAILHQRVDVFVVDGQPFALVVRSVRPH